MGLLVVLVLLTGYLGVMVYTFAAGGTAKARVDHCSHGARSTHCYGSWTGQDTNSGEITGASASDVGTVVPVRVGPFGAYVDDMATPLLRIGVPSLFDLLILGGAYLTVGRGRRTRRALLDTRDGALAGTVADARLTAPDGSVVLTDAGDGRVVHGSGGAPAFATQSDGGTIQVTWSDGRPAGSAIREPGAGGWTFADAQGRSVGTMRTDASAFLRGRGFRVLDGMGRPAATILGRGFERLVVRVEAHTGEPLRTLVLAFALTSARVVVRP